MKDGFKLGELTIYPLECRVSSPDGDRKLTPRAADVLLYIAEHSSAVIERDKLLYDVWDGRAQSDEPLNKVISELRRVLMDNASQPVYIQTIPKRGYRLLVAPEPLTSATAQGVQPAERIVRIPSKRLATILALPAIAILVAIVLVVGQGDDDNPTAKPATVPRLVNSNNPSIVVLPFDDMSEHGDQEYFSDGISEELLNLLAQSPELDVISRTSAFAYKGKDRAVPDIANDLKVSYVLEGSVRKAGTTIRITAQLIDARSDMHLWSETYDRKLGDVFDIQDEIAAKVVENLNVTLQDSAYRDDRVDAAAYDLLFQARYLDRQRTPETQQRAIELLQQALEIDAGYADAWEYLGMLYMTQAEFGLRPIEEGYELARDSANHALLLEPDHYASHSLLARIARNYDRDFPRAANHYQRAIELRPESGANYGNAALLVAVLGQRELALQMAMYASSRVPVDPIGHANIGHHLYYAGRYDDAIKSYRKAVTLSPGYVGAHYSMAICYMKLENLSAAFEAIEKESLEAYRLIGHAILHHDAGDRAAADAALDALIAKYERDASYNIAYIYADRGDLDNAFAYLDKAVLYRDTGLMAVTLNPLFDALHNDPRWLPFLHSAGMAPEQLGDVEFKISVPAVEATGAGI